MATYPADRSFSDEGWMSPTLATSGWLDLELIQGAAAGVTNASAENAAVSTTANDPSASVKASAESSDSAVSSDILGQVPFKVADRGSEANTTAGSTTVVDLPSASAIRQGNLLIARIAVDNAGTSGAAPTLSVSDPRGNSWTVLGPVLADPGLASEGVAGYLAYAVVTASLTDGDDVTLTWDVSPTAKAVVVEEWQNVCASNVVAVTYNWDATGAITIVRTPTSAGQLAYGAVAIEGPLDNSPNPPVYDSDTTDGVWVNLTRAGAGTGASGMTVDGQYKIVSGTSSQTWDFESGNPFPRDNAGMFLVFERGINTATDASTVSGIANDATIAISSQVAAQVAEASVGQIAVGAFGNNASAWSGLGTPTPAVERSTTRAYEGDASLKVTWGTSAAYAQNAIAVMSNLVVGQTYRIEGYVYVPSGSPDTYLGAYFWASGDPVTTKDAWAPISCTFIAEDTSRSLVLGHSTAATSGDVAWLDAVTVTPVAIAKVAPTSDISTIAAASDSASTAVASPVTSADGTVTTDNATITTATAAQSECATASATTYDVQASIKPSAVIAEVEFGLTSKGDFGDPTDLYDYYATGWTSLSRDTSQTYNGKVASLRVEYTSNTLDNAYLLHNDPSPGEWIMLTVVVYVPTGAPNIFLRNDSLVPPYNSPEITTKDAWVEATLVYPSSGGYVPLEFRSSSPGTPMTFWVGQVQTVNLTRVTSQPTMQSADVSGDASGSVGAVAPNAECATGSATAYDATVTIFEGTDAPAESALVSCVANDATVQTAVSASATEATSAATANDAQLSIKPTASDVTSSAASLDATTSVNVSVDTASVTTVVDDVYVLRSGNPQAENVSVVASGVNADVATSPTETPSDVTTSAYDATVSVAPVVTESAASVTGEDATVTRSAVALAESVSVSAAAYDTTTQRAGNPTPTDAAVTSVDTSATVAVAPSVPDSAVGINDTSASVAIAISSQEGTVAAVSHQTQITSTGSAENVSVTATANDAAAAIASVSSDAAASGSANDVTGMLSTGTDAAQASVTVEASSSVSVSPDDGAGIGAAYDTTTMREGHPSAENASVVASVYGPAVATFVVASPTSSDVLVDARDATGQVAPTVSAVDVSVSAVDAIPDTSGNTSASAESSDVTGSGSDASVAVWAAADATYAVGEANDATVSISQPRSVSPNEAVVSASSYDATVSRTGNAIAELIDTAVVTQTATVAIASTSSSSDASGTTDNAAGTAATGITSSDVLGQALDAAAAVAASSSASTALVEGTDSTVSGYSSVSSADVSVLTDASVSVSVSAAVADVSGNANDASTTRSALPLSADANSAASAFDAVIATSIVADAGVSNVSIQVQDAQGSVGASAVISDVVAQSVDPTVTTSGNTNATASTSDIVAVAVDVNSVLVSPTVDLATSSVYGEDATGDVSQPRASYAEAVDVAASAVDAVITRSGNADVDSANVNVVSWSPSSAISAPAEQCDCISQSPTAVGSVKPSADAVSVLADSLDAVVAVVASVYAESASVLGVSTDADTSRAGLPNAYVADVTAIAMDASVATRIDATATSSDVAVEATDVVSQISPLADSAAVSAEVADGTSTEAPLATLADVSVDAYSASVLVSEITDAYADSAVVTVDVNDALAGSSMVAQPDGIYVSADVTDVSALVAVTPTEADSTATAESASSTSYTLVTSDAAGTTAESLDASVTSETTLDLSAEASALANDATTAVATEVRFTTNRFPPNVASACEDGTTTGINDVAGTTTVAASTEESLHGTHSVLWTTTGAQQWADIGLGSNWPCIPGVPITFVGWVKAKAGYEGARFRFLIRLSTDTNFEQPLFATAEVVATSSSTEWRKFYTTVNPNAVTNNIWINVHQEPPPTPVGGDQFYFDQFALYYNSTSTDWEMSSGAQDIFTRALAPHARVQPTASDISVTAQANDATVVTTVSASAEMASVDTVVPDVVARTEVLASADAATVTVDALDALAQRAVVAYSDAAALIGESLDAQTAIYVNADAATAAFEDLVSHVDGQTAGQTVEVQSAALDASVITSEVTDAAADAVAVDAAAYDATVTATGVGAAPATTADVTALANNADVLTSSATQATAESADAATTAYDVTAHVATDTSSASGTATSSDVSATVDLGATSTDVTVSANDASVLVGLFADAGSGESLVEAYDASISIAVGSVSATVTGSVTDSTATVLVGVVEVAVVVTTEDVTSSAVTYTYAVAEQAAVSAYAIQSSTALLISSDPADLLVSTPTLTITLGLEVETLLIATQTESSPAVAVSSVESSALAEALPPRPYTESQLIGWGLPL